MYINVNTRTLTNITGTVVESHPKLRQENYYPI